MAAKKKIKSPKMLETAGDKSLEQQGLDPSSSGRGFPIVGIGASAGGLAAFEAFFSAMPAGIDTGMAFILVQHLAPDHKSMLAELIRHYTRMKVSEVEDGMHVEPNCAYIIPPNRDMALLHSSLHLLEPSSPRGQRSPIDFFFRSLAVDQHERAIGIILSGTGSDGTAGIRAIKSEGGMAMVQNPESTEYDGMPRSAIATGLVDYIMPPAEMPAQLMNYAVHAFGNPPRPICAPSSKGEIDMKKIFTLIRARTGHDFSGYKSSTIRRRTERRMAVHQIDQLEEYVRYLQTNPLEVEALFNDLLIGVTSFFRDPEAFMTLQTHAIPKLFEGKIAGDTIRIWVPGCSTGEEAYSIAMLLQEELEARKQYFKFQIFATDIDKKAIEVARTGNYPVSIADNVSAERLARFFTQEADNDNYRILKVIRDFLVFSEQNLIKDPPFSKVDLISCRNLLIYLESDLQKKILPLFHYALNPGGILFLGTSETVGDFSSLFSIIDRQAKIYQKQPAQIEAQRTNFLSSLPSLYENSKTPNGISPATAAVQRKQNFRELTEHALLQHYAASGVLINEHGDIFYLHGRTGRYLEPAPGEASLNILKMAREGLQRVLSEAIRKAVFYQETVHQENLLVKTNGDFSTVRLTVKPLKAVSSKPARQTLYLVILEEVHPSLENKLANKSQSAAAVENQDDRFAVVEQELRNKEELLQSAREELESSNEELKASNEEMQSMNEELQSTNEELETSKEELQSVNEELSTVNSELQNKVSDLSQANNDLNNLLAGTGVGTVFLDHQQRIRRFTPSITQVINLIPTDVGRPLGHIHTNLVGYDHLVSDIQSVLDTLVPKEVEVTTKEGAWFILRIRPYRTLENVIEGAVVAFFDITTMKQTLEILRENKGKADVLFEIMPQGVLFQDPRERIIEANPAAQRILGLPVEQIKGKRLIQSRWKTIRPDGSVFPEEDQPARIALTTGQAVQDVILGLEFPHKAGTTWLRVNSIPLFKPEETTPYQVVTTIDEITNHLKSEMTGEN